MCALLALILSCAGFGAIALSMRRHHQDVFGRPPGRARKLILGTIGWLLLGTAIWPAIAGQGTSIGIVFWFGIVTLAALIVAMSLTYGPAAARALSRASKRDAKSPDDRSNDETGRHAALGMADLCSDKRK